MMKCSNQNLEIDVPMGIFDYIDCKEFHSFLDDAGARTLTRDELIKAYVNNLYGVTLENFREAGMVPPTKEEITELKK
jgi:hypothetical protein